MRGYAYPYVCIHTYHGHGHGHGIFILATYHEPARYCTPQSQSIQIGSFLEVYDNDFACVHMHACIHTPVLGEHTVCQLTRTFWSNGILSVLDFITKQKSVHKDIFLQIVTR